MNQALALLKGMTLAIPHPQPRFTYLNRHSLIRSGVAIPFTGHAAPPTVTLPCIKAITTGSIPGFADVMGNLDRSDASSFANQDSWLRRLRNEDRKLVFYGDGTWTRLFDSGPLGSRFFTRAESVNGFLTSVSEKRSSLRGPLVSLTFWYTGSHRS